MFSTRTRLTGFSSPSRPHRRAFTLVELLVVISVIAMLMKLVLPAINKARCEGRKLTVATNIQDIIGFFGAHPSGVLGYTTDVGCIPKRIDDLDNDEYLSFYDELVVDLTVTTLSDPERVISEFTDPYAYASYTYFYPPMLLDPWGGDRWPPDPLPECLSLDRVYQDIGTHRALVMVAEGRTIADGRELDFVVLGFLDGHVEFVDGGCEIALAEQQAALEARGFEAFADLLFLNQQSPDPLPPERIKQGLSDPDTIAASVQVLDAVPDGTFKGNDLHALAKIDIVNQPASTFADIAGNFTATNSFQVLGEFARDAIEITGIPEDDPTEIDLLTLLLALLDGLPPGEEPPFDVTPPGEFLSFEGLASLTRMYSANPGVANGLCAKLSAATRAYEAGQAKVVDNAVKAYQHLLRAQTGKAFTAEQADVLRVLSYSLPSPSTARTRHRSK